MTTNPSDRSPAASETDGAPGPAAPAADRVATDIQRPSVDQAVG